MTENPYGLPLETQLDLYEKGRKLRKFVLDPDWEIVIQVLQDYRDKYRDALVSLAPGDPQVPLAHAAASASNDIFEYFTKSINNAVDFSNEPPKELKGAIHGIRKAVEAAQGGR